MKSTNTAKKMESGLALRPEAGALNAMHFDNRFVRDLPADPSTENVPRQVTGACYSRVLPTPVAAPKRVAYSPEAAELRGLSDETCRSDEFAQVFTGNRLLPEMDPYATCYGGRQFGRWAGQLGDGRAINLGDVVNGRGGRWALQLKGAGPTPYRRTADGLAVLRSSVREFLASEAMFYDGRTALEPRAVVCRVAPAHEPGEPQVHPAKLHGPGGHRKGGTGRLFPDPRTARPAAPPLRRAAGAGAFCRKAPGLGTRLPGGVDAVVQLLERLTRACSDRPISAFILGSVDIRASSRCPLLRRIKKKTLDIAPFSGFKYR